jgi:hypothetical protein
VKYLLMIYGSKATWDGWSEADYQTVISGHTALHAELVRTGELVSTEGLTSAGARTVRVRGGLPVVTDGPFTEAKEMLAGYYLVECESLERATEIAGRLPEARFDLVEVRRVMGKAEFGMEHSPLVR